MNSNTCFLRAIVLMIVAMSLLITVAMAEQITFQGKPVIEGTWRGELAQYVAGEILVMFQDSDVNPDDIVRSVNGKLVRGIEQDGFAKIEVDQSADIPALCENLYDSYSL
jgi:hypothetical protein